MATPVKKREVEPKNKKSLKDSDDFDSSNGEDNDEAMEEQGMEIQVDFEGRNPQDPDYHGIKTLLQQLFLKAHIDLGGLTDLIISQNYVGSVVKRAMDDDGSDEDDDDTNDIFGITTVINISDRQNVTCIRQLRELLRQLAGEHATDATDTVIQKVLDDDSAVLGLLINERFVNIPAQISVPLLENLVAETKRSVSKKMPFDFTHYILICKLYELNEKARDSKKKSKRNRERSDSNILWSNPEEEIFAEEASYSFQSSVESESDSGLSGSWTESDDEMTPCRRVLLLESSKLHTIIEKIKTELS